MTYPTPELTTEPTLDLTPESEPTMHDTPPPPTMTNTVQTEQTDPVEPELPQSIDTPTPDPTPTKPSILHIFDDT